MRSPARPVRAVVRRASSTARATARRIGAVGRSAVHRYDDAATPEVAARIRELAARNATSTSPITDPASDVTVTMTSHGHRIRRTWTALESIAAGTRLPRRLVLALSAHEARRLPRRIRSLQRRGLEVLPVDEALGVHTKWYPVARGLDGPLVTSDDDQIYPVGWLAELVDLHVEHPADVIVHRAHRIGVEDGAVVPYLRWQQCLTSDASPRHFGTSVSGQLLPEAVHRMASASGTRFLDVAPTADDVWLHRSALAAGAGIRQVRTEPANYPFVPGTQGAGLYQGNVLGGGNDVQVAATYGERELERLRDDR